jgi:hypothetical protein
MPIKKNVFTVREIAAHLLNQAIMADTDFQLNQQSAWQQMNKQDTRYAGFSKASSLFLNEMDFSFELMPTPLSWWEKIKLLFGGRLKSRGTFYTVASASAPSESKLKIKISIKREGQGKYDSAITTTPETPLKPEEINVVGFIK